MCCIEFRKRSRAGDRGSRDATKPRSVLMMEFRLVIWVERSVIPGVASIFESDPELGPGGPGEVNLRVIRSHEIRSEICR